VSQNKKETANIIKEGTGEWTNPSFKGGEVDTHGFTYQEKKQGRKPLGGEEEGGKRGPQTLQGQKKKTTRIGGRGKHKPQ